MTGFPYYPKLWSCLVLKHWRSLLGYQSIVCCNWIAIATLIQVWSPSVYVLHVCTPCNHLSLKSRHLRWLSQSIWRYCSEDLQISLCFSLSNVFPLLFSWTFWTSKHHFSFPASHLAKVSLGLQNFDSLRGKWLLGGHMHVILPNTLLQKVNHCWPFQLFEEFTWLQNFHLLFWAEMKRKFGWWCLHWLWGGVKGNHLSSNFS